jgi:hypothetical protein
MTDDAKQAAWHHYCKRLEVLGVDPYKPDLPTDDPRHDDVKVIVADYRGITPIKLPSGWEGTPPESLASLADVVAWLRDEWNIVCAIKMAGDEAKANAKSRASRAIRNTFRILDSWAVEDRPDRPVPPKNLDDAKHQIESLIQWMEEKHKTGWTPAPEKAKATTAKKGKRRKEDAIPNDEANELARDYIKTHPQATARELAGGIGVALGRVSNLPAWRAEVGRRQVGKLPSPKKTRPLTKKMLASISVESDPAKLAEIREAAWQRIIDEAKSPDERAKLFALNSKGKERLIDIAVGQFADMLAEGDYEDGS